MKGPRVLIGLLVAASVLVDLVAWSVIRHRWPPLFNPATLTFAALAFSQVNLLAIWAALGRKAAPWRLTALMVGIALWVRLLANARNAEAFSGANATAWAITFLLQASMVITPLSVARAMGVGLVHAAADADGDDPEAGGPRLQFSLSQILGWMTSLAVVLGLTKLLVRFDSLPLTHAQWLETILLICLSQAVLALPALWFALGTRWPAVRTFLLCLAVMLPPIATEAALHGRHSVKAMASVVALEALLLVGSLVVVRLAGWRLAIGRKRGGQAE